MKTTGIIMSGDHPKLILDGIKTMTRRVIKLKRYRRDVWNCCVPHNGIVAELLGEPYLKVPYDEITDNAGTRITCPYGQVGDRLWVKETWSPTALPDKPMYRATPNIRIDLVTWKPSIFMPRWASRITLEITEVKVEHLNQISESDVIKEGVDNLVTFMLLWDRLNKKRGYEWKSNCWVWVITSKLCQ